MDPAPDASSATADHATPTRRAPGAFAFGLLVIVAAHGALAYSVLRQGLGHVLEVEEDFIAFAARELGAGAVLPATTYLYTDYEAGTLYVAAWTAPFVAVLGPTLLAIKLASIALSGLMVALVGLAGRRLVGPRASLFAAAVVAAGPPVLMVRALQALGDTSEVLPLLLLQWALFARWARGGEGPDRARLLALGAVGGLAVGFSLASVPFQLALMVLAWSRRPDARAWGTVAAGVALGLAVPVWNAVVHGIAFWNVRGSSPVAGLAGPPAWIALGGSLFARDAPGFFVDDFPDELVPGAAQLPRLYALAVHGAWLAACVVHRRELGRLARACCPGRAAAPPHSGPVILVALHGAFLLAWIATRYGSGYLLALLAPSGALLLGHVLARAWARGWQGTASLACASVLAVVLWPLAMLWHPGPTQPLLEAPAGEGGRWRGFLRARAWLRVPPGPAPALEEVAMAVAGDAIEPDELYGAGQYLAMAYDGDEAVAHVGVALAALDPLRAVQLARGFGYGRAWPGEARQLAAVQGLLGLKGYRDEALAGFGRCLGERFARRGGRELRQELLDSLEADARAAVVFGLGYGYGWRLWHHPGYFQHEILQLAALDRPALARGLVIRLAEMGPAASWPPRLAELDAPLVRVLPREWRRRFSRDDR